MFGTKPSVAVLFDRSPPNRAQPASPDFEAARRLVQQGKNDEAVAALTNPRYNRAAQLGGEDS
jgi:hypothetical protein